MGNMSLRFVLAGGNIFHGAMTGRRDRRVRQERRGRHLQIFKKIIRFF